MLVASLGLYEVECSPRQNSSRLSQNYLAVVPSVQRTVKNYNANPKLSCKRDRINLQLRTAAFFTELRQPLWIHYLGVPPPVVVLEEQILRWLSPAY